jgi:hypothetical protein
VEQDVFRRFFAQILSPPGMTFQGQRGIVSNPGKLAACLSSPGSAHPRLRGKPPAGAPACSRLWTRTSITTRKRFIRFENHRGQSRWQIGAPPKKELLPGFEIVFRPQPDTTDSGIPVNQTAGPILCLKIYASQLLLGRVAIPPMGERSGGHGWQSSAGDRCGHARPPRGNVEVSG